jgi:hypothetical protein
VVLHSLPPSYKSFVKRFLGKAAHGEDQASWDYTLTSGDHWSAGICDIQMLEMFHKHLCSFESMRY